jgi:hypothetical protein
MREIAMKKLGNVQSAVRRYHNAYRNPKLRRPRLSGLYALFPGSNGAHKANFSWPEAWPDAEEPGVYMVFDSRLNLLYVGKARKIGWRLSEYFRYGKTRQGGLILGQCGVSKRYTWSRRPEYIATVRVDQAFEASSLEEYLIVELRPPDNTAGKD